MTDVTPEPLNEYAVSSCSTTFYSSFIPRHVRKLQIVLVKSTLQVLDLSAPDRQASPDIHLLCVLSSISSRSAFSAYLLHFAVLPPSEVLDPAVCLALQYLLKQHLLFHYFIVVRRFWRIRFLVLIFGGCFAPHRSIMAVISTLSIRGTTTAGKQ